MASPRYALVYSRTSKGPWYIARTVGEITRHRSEIWTTTDPLVAERVAKEQGGQVVMLPARRGR